MKLRSGLYMQLQTVKKREYSYIRLIIGVFLLIIVGLMASMGTFIRAVNTMGSILLIVAGIILMLIFVVAIYLLKQ